MKQEEPFAAKIASRQSRISHIILLFSVSVFLAAQTALAAKNPLNTIDAASFDTKNGSLATGFCLEGGLDLCSIQAGNYVVYRGYDFDSGVADVSIRLASTTQGVIEIRLDHPSGPLMARCPFTPTGGWQSWRNITAEIDNNLSGVRDIYLVFQGERNRPLVNIRSFVFLKSIVPQGDGIPLGFPDRTDTADDEPQSANTWGMPENGLSDGFEAGVKNWETHGLTLTPLAIGGKASLAGSGTNFNFAFTPNGYLNKTDSGGDWRTLSQGSLAADIIMDSPDARPGIGFISRNAKQWIAVTLNPATDTIEVWRKLSTDNGLKLKEYSIPTNEPNGKVIQTGLAYRLQLDWSPYSDGLIVFLHDNKGQILANFRTVIDLPSARRPLLVSSGGAARFDNIQFDPTLDNWNLKWQWKKTPILASDVCNPAIWKWHGTYYMMWRKFGADNYHGIVKSQDGISWTRVKDEVLRCTGDMNVVVDPFGDGKVYITPGGNRMSWWCADGTNDFTVWKETGLNLGDIYGNCRVQEIIDTQKYPQMAPITFEGGHYRFIAYTEDWNRKPKPHTVILLSNTLTNWVLAGALPLIPPSGDFWGEKGNAIGSAMVLPDGNILISSCSCTFAGYTGAPEPSNVSAIADGRQPWKILKLATLPDAPVSREKVWYEGPNFGTAFYYEAASDTLFFYGGFHDYYIGMMRVEHFSRSRLFQSKPALCAAPGGQSGAATP